MTRLVFAVTALAASAAAADDDWENHWLECPRRVEVRANESTEVRVASPVLRFGIPGSGVADYDVVAPRRIRVLGIEPGFTTLTAWLANGSAAHVCVKVTMPLRLNPSQPYRSVPPCANPSREKGAAIQSVMMKPGTETELLARDWEGAMIADPAIVAVSSSDQHHVRLRALALGTTSVTICRGKHTLLAVFVTAEGGAWDRVEEMVEQQSKADAGRRGV